MEHIVKIQDIQVSLVSIFILNTGSISSLIGKKREIAHLSYKDCEVSLFFQYRILNNSQITLCDICKEKEKSSGLQQLPVKSLWPESNYFAPM